jgi:hypothetical protein
VLLARRRRRNFRRSLVVAWCNCPPRGVAPASLKDTPYKEGLTRRAKRKAPTRHRGLPTTRYESVERAQPRIDVRSHLILVARPSALLDFPLQLFALSVDLSEIVVAELALLFSDLSRSLLPISFDTIPVYGLFLHDKRWLLQSNVVLILKFRAASSNEKSQSSRSKALVFGVVRIVRFLNAGNKNNRPNFEIDRP